MPTPSASENALTDLVAEVREIAGHLTVVADVAEANRQRAVAKFYREQADRLTAAANRAENSGTH